MEKIVNEFKSIYSVVCDYHKTVTFSSTSISSSNNNNSTSSYNNNNRIYKNPNLLYHRKSSKFIDDSFKKTKILPTDWNPSTLSHQCTSSCCYATTTRSRISSSSSCVLDQEDHSIIVLLILKGTIACAVLLVFYPIIRLFDTINFEKMILFFLSLHALTIRDNRVCDGRISGCILLIVLLRLHIYIIPYLLTEVPLLQIATFHSMKVIFQIFAYLVVWYMIYCFIIFFFSNIFVHLKAILYFFLTADLNDRNSDIYKIKKNGSNNYSNNNNNNIKENKNHLARDETKKEENIENVKIITASTPKKSIHLCNPWGLFCSAALLLDSICDSNYINNYLLCWQSICIAEIGENGWFISCLFALLNIINIDHISKIKAFTVLLLSSIKERKWDLFIVIVNSCLIVFVAIIVWKNFYSNRRNKKLHEEEEEKEEISGKVKMDIYQIKNDKVSNSTKLMIEDIKNYLAKDGSDNNNNYLVEESKKKYSSFFIVYIYYFIFSSFMLFFFVKTRKIIIEVEYYNENIHETLINTISCFQVVYMFKLGKNKIPAIICLIHLIKRDFPNFSIVKVSSSFSTSWFISNQNNIEYYFSVGILIFLYRLVRVGLNTWERGIVQKSIKNIFEFSYDLFLKFNRYVLLKIDMQNKIDKVLMIMYNRSLKWNFSINTIILSLMVLNLCFTINPSDECKSKFLSNKEEILLDDNPKTFNRIIILVHSIYLMGLQKRDMIVGLFSFLLVIQAEYLNDQIEVLIIIMHFCITISIVILMLWKIYLFAKTSIKIIAQRIKNIVNSTFIIKASSGLFPYSRFIFKFSFGFFTQLILILSISTLTYLYLHHVKGNVLIELIKVIEHYIQDFSNIKYQLMMTIKLASHEYEAKAEMFGNEDDFYAKDIQTTYLKDTGPLHIYDESFQARIFLLKSVLDKIVPMYDKIQLYYDIFWRCCLEIINLQQHIIRSNILMKKVFFSNFLWKQEYCIILNNTMTVTSYLMISSFIIIRKRSIFLTTVTRKLCSRFYSIFDMCLVNFFYYLDKVSYHPLEEGKKKPLILAPQPPKKPKLIEKHKIRNFERHRKLITLNYLNHYDIFAFMDHNKGQKDVTNTKNAQYRRHSLQSPNIELMTSKARTIFDRINDFNKKPTISKNINIESRRRFSM